ncbi:MAG: ISAs1 family transposase, partial [Aeromonas media]
TALTAEFTVGEGKLMTHDEPCSMAPDDKHDLISGTCSHLPSAVRGHWAIENSLHWVLDVVMNEDACQIYRGDAPQILACARHMAQNMLRAETSRKASLRKKQQFAGMSSPYLEKVLDAGLAELASI